VAVGRPKGSDKQVANKVMNARFKQFALKGFSRGEATTVALVSPRPQLHETLKGILKKDKRYQFVGIQGDLIQVGTQLGVGSPSTVLVADLQGSLDAAIAAIERVRSSGFNGAIITLSETLDEVAVRGLLRLRVSDWLPTDAGSDEIIEACGRASDARTLVGKGAKARCVALVPAAGGVGTTTLAIQTAVLFGKRSRNLSRTCLVDLNFQSGSLADYLDLEPLFDMEAIAGDPSRLDAQLLEMMLARHASGLAVLAAPRTPTEPPRADGKLVTSALTMASDTFEHMVLDLPTTWQQWTFDVLAGSDQIYVVTEFTVPAMRKAHELVEAISGRFSREVSIKVIVNKFRQQLFGGLRKTDAISLLGDRLAGFVPEDYELVSEAINRGEFVSAISRSNRVSKQLGLIVLNE
jgi:pilus assembly protein CpaE